MPQDFTIACLLKPSSVEKLTNTIPFLEKNNHPHISLFQFRSSDEKFHFLLKKYIKNLSIPKNFLTTNLSLVEKNIFLNIADDSTLQTASDQLADFYANYNMNKEPLSQIQITELTSHQRTLVSKYGIHWIKENYKPHVTLLYEKDFHGSLNLKIPESIDISLPEIYAIDHLGRVYNK